MVEEGEEEEEEGQCRSKSEEIPPSVVRFVLPSLERKPVLFWNYITRITVIRSRRAPVLTD